MNKKLNIILANISLRTINKGTVALTISSMTLIDEMLKDKGIEYELYLCTNEFEDGHHYTLSVDGRDINYKVCGSIRQKGIMNKIRMRLRFRKFKRDKKIFHRADYIFDIGWGDSFSDIYGESRFYILDSIHKTAIKLKKPYYLLPQTIGPFKKDTVLHEAVQSLANADLVMTRDRQSYNYTKQICPHVKKLGEYVDVAFFLPYQKMSFDRDYIHVGINISEFMRMGGYTHTNQFGLVIDYDKIIHHIIDYFLAMPDVKVHLIGHVVSGDQYTESDYTTCRDVYHEYNHKNLVLGEFFLSPIDAKNYISGLDFFIGARMHATIAAFSSLVPVVPMAYSRKFNGLFIDTLNYNHLVDMKKDDEETTLQIIKECFEARQALKDEEKKQMMTTVATAKESLLRDMSVFLEL